MSDGRYVFIDHISLCAVVVIDVIGMMIYVGGARASLLRLPEFIPKISEASHHYQET